MQAAIISMRSGDGDDEGLALAEALHAGAIAEALPSLGIDACVVCETGSPAALMPLAVPRLCVAPRGVGRLFRLWQWRRKHSEVLIIAVGGGASQKTARWLARLGKKNMGRLFSAFFFAPPDRLSQRLLDGQDCCICGSSFIRERIAEAHFKSRPELLEAAPGIDLSAYEYPASQRPQGGRFVFGMGQSLAENSGALLLVRAMSALWQQEDLPPWEARMFGGGHRFEEIIDEAEKLGVSSRLAILNEQPLGEVTRHCHVWLAPGTSPDEHPQTLWAGFAAGLPVIAAKSPLHSERIWEKGAALEIQADNPQKMARIMLKMLRDEKWRQKIAGMGAPMRPRISLDGMAQRVCAIIASKFPAMASEKIKAKK